MTVDPLEIVRQWLCQGDTDLSALVGSRVYYPWLPDKTAGGAGGFDNSEAGVVLVLLDGGSVAQTAVQDVEVEIRCFGGGAEVRKEPRRAWATYKALRARFIDADDNFVSGQVLPAGRLISVEEVKGGSYEVEPGLNWPFVSSNWAFEVASA